MTRIADAMRWHKAKGHNGFVESAKSLHWSDTFVYNTCILVGCDHWCHCGRPVHTYTEAGMVGFSRGMCEPCTEVRCDTVEYAFSGEPYMPSCPPL